MLIQLLWFSFFLLTSALDVVVDERARAWTVLSWLSPSSKELLAEVYPYIAGIEEIEGEDTLVDFLVDKIAASDEELAALFEVTYEHYPMGIMDEGSIGYAGINQNVAVLNGVNYTEPDKVFYFKTDDLKKQAQIEDLRLLRDSDVVIGDSKTKDGEQIPLVLFYGCPGTDDFDEFSRSLYNEATQSKKLRFIWRSTCGPNKPLDHNPFPVGITVKDIPGDVEKVLNSGVELDLPKGLEKVNAKQFEDISVEDLEKLDFKLITLLSQYFRKNGRDFKKLIEYSKQTINNLPLLVPQILATKEKEEKILESNKYLNNMGVDHNLLGLFINGQYIKYPLAHMSTLLNVIKTEYQYVTELREVLKVHFKDISISTVKKLISYYSVFSVPNLDALQPYKVDTHRIPGYSESVIYFNDIENDKVYAQLDDSVDVFFEESKFGEIPELRQNWNEIVFVIDFDKLKHDVEVKNSLEAVVRTLQVVETGYPQRIGLIPFSSSGKDQTVKKIYELKARNDLAGITNLLNDITQNPGKTIVSSFKEIPDYRNVLKELSIDETSIIINGNIFKFKSNSWNYLLAMTIKRDVKQVKDELHKMSSYKKDLDVRKLLHSKSLPKRNKKFTTTYFEEATYTRINNTALELFKDRVLEQEKYSGYNLLHTITLIDDFNTKSAIDRLHAIVKNKFSGVKFRIIHTGENGKKSCWKGFTKTRNDVDFSSFKAGRCSVSPGVDTNANSYLSTWLLDIPSHDLDGTPMLVVNGRVIFLGDGYIPETSDIEAFLTQESKRTLDLIYVMENVFNSFSSQKIDPSFMEAMSSYMTKLYYQASDSSEGPLFYSTETSLPRMDLGNLRNPNDLTMFSLFEDEDRAVEINLVLDPVEERSQKLLSLVENFIDLPFVNLHLSWYSTENINIVPNNRIYLDDAEDLTPLLSSGLDIDIDKPCHVKMDHEGNISEFMVQAHVYPAEDQVELGNVEGQANICIQLRDSAGKIVSRAITMSTYGYAQLGISDLSQSYTIESCDSRFKVDSFSMNPKAEYVPNEKLFWRSSLPETVYVKVSPSNKKDDTEYDTERINLFTVMYGNEDEEKFKTTILNTILTTGGRPITFYVWDEPFISQEFRDFAKAVPSSVKGKDVSVVFVRYEWPLWIRPQRFRERRLAASSLIFLDLLFPSDVAKLLIIPPDMATIDIVDIYDSEIKRMFAMKKMTGKGYWSSGYWAEQLEKYKAVFHSTKPFIYVNMKQMRLAYGGDYLRIHYQRLSTDINSLQVIDQDLLNDLQMQIPIRTLRKSAIKSVDVNTAKFNKLKAKLKDLVKVEEEKDDYIKDEL